MAIINKHIETKNGHLFVGIVDKFQGIGISMRFDEPVCMYKDRFSIEVLFLWLKFWYVRYSEKSNDKDNKI